MPVLPVTDAATSALHRPFAHRRQRMDRALRVKLATPCKADWSQMKGDDRARFCAMCRKNVFNISALTAQQARELVRQKEGNLCVAFYQRPDGTVLTADCPVAVNAA